MRQERVHFPERTGSPGVIDIRLTSLTTLLPVAVAISGFEIGFTNDEHPVLKTTIDAEVVTVTGTMVTVLVIFSIQDNSGTFDDPFRGFVNLLVIVDRV